MKFEGMIARLLAFLWIVLACLVTIMCVGMCFGRDASVLVIFFIWSSANISLAGLYSGLLWVIGAEDPLRRTRCDR
jgi:hypothetical protein